MLANIAHRNTESAGNIDGSTRPFIDTKSYIKESGKPVGSTH